MTRPVTRVKSVCEFSPDGEPRFYHSTPNNPLVFFDEHTPVTFEVTSLAQALFGCRSVVTRRLFTPAPWLPLHKVPYVQLGGFFVPFHKVSLDY